MSEHVQFEDYSLKVKGLLEDQINTFLREAGGEVEAQAKRNTGVGKVAGGQLKSSWKYDVNESEHSVTIGSPLERAIWYELGTGEYAAEGNGRKGGWYILIGEGKGQISQNVVDAYGFKVVYGKDGKKYAYTKGMKPRRPLKKAFESSVPKLQRRLETLMKGMSK